MNGQNQSGASDILSKLGTLFSSLMSNYQKGASAGAGGGPSGTPGQPGLALPSPQPPRYNMSPGGGPGASSLPAPLGAPSASPISPRTATQSPLLGTGFEFATHGGRDAAVTTSAIQGVSDFLSQARQRKDERTRTQAEGYMNQITAAQQAGDQQALNLLLEDPKVVKSLEKGLNYYMEMVPSEAPPPEARGIKSSLDKLIKTGGRLPAPNTPGGVSLPQDPLRGGQNQLARLLQQIQLMQAQGAKGRLEKDPELAAQMGLGTGLSGAETKEAERYAAGLASSPVAERQAFLAHQDLLDKFAQENKMMLTETASREKIAMAGLTSAERQTRISAGPLYYRANIAKQIADSQVKVKEMVANGKVNEANKFVMQTLTSQINDLRNNSEKAKKDGNDDMAVEFKKQADELQKRYDDVQKSQNLNIDQVINDLLQ